MPDNKLTLLIKASYLQLIKNSVGSKTWQNYYAQVNSQKKDIVQKGQLSCSFFVSSILVMFNLVKKIHLTVSGTKKDMLSSGWYSARNPLPGYILIWEPTKDSNWHQHIGFCISKNQAVSMNPRTGKPVVHQITYNQKRKIIEVYAHLKIQ